MISRTTGTEQEDAGIKQVPQDAETRLAIRQRALEAASRLPAGRPPTRVDLEQTAGALLQSLGLPGSYLGFAMVAVSNAFWRDAYSAIAFDRRLLLLPHCLSDRSACAGTYDSVGLNCAGCGSCDIHALHGLGTKLGYQVIVAEGTSSVLMRVMEGKADALLGVACLDSLEKSFTRIVELGIPHLALPLLRDGCVDTEAEVEQIRELMLMQSAGQRPTIRSYVPLLRQTVRLFEKESLDRIVGDLHRGTTEGGEDTALAATDQMAMQWLRDGGKRLRPFITLVSYAVVRHGLGVLSGEADLDHLIPLSVLRLAAAIEVLHKASLVHDDIEDHDEYRYGQQTLYRRHGVGPAVNVGDYLIGLGYALIAGEQSLGGDCQCDILRRLARAHLELCRGQGAELTWQANPRQSIRVRDVLEMYALKTAPAFEVAFYAGLRAAGMHVADDLLSRFSVYLGQAFQITNDLDDWRDDDRNKLVQGLDVLAERQTVLRAFAAEPDGGRELLETVGEATRRPAAEVLERVRQLYVRREAFAKAQRLLEKLRGRAMESATQFPTADLRELMRFLVALILPEGAHKR